MNNIDLINALYSVIYWFLEILRSIFAILIVPFQILYAYFSMDLSDATAYSKHLAYIRWNRLKMFGVTLKFTLENRTPHLSVHSYDEDTEEASQHINSIKHPTIHAKIAQGLKEARRYRYVIYETNSSGITFIQLRSDTGIYLFDFPLTPLSLNRDYAVQLIDFFQSSGFNKAAPGTTYRNKTYSIEALEDELTTIQANLGTNETFAVDFCTRIFKNIFHSTVIPEVTFG